MRLRLDGVRPTFGAVLCAPALTGLCACLWPARRAARMDPAGALRCD